MVTITRYNCIRGGPQWCTPDFSSIIFALTQYAFALLPFQWRTGRREPELEYAVIVLCNYSSFQPTIAHMPQVFGIRIWSIVIPEDFRAGSFNVLPRLFCHVVLRSWAAMGYANIDLLTILVSIART